MSLIELTQINLILDGKEIFHDFNLGIVEGEKIRITGKSGRGKSTLLRMLLGFQRWDSGEIRFRGKPVEDRDFREIRRKFAYVDQEVSLRPGNAREVLQQVARFSGNHYDGGLDKALSAAFEFDERLLDKKTEELSGGERQRLGILLAIRLGRPVYLLDEVTSALDRELKGKVVDFFSRCEQTVIVVSHDSEWNQFGVFREVEW